MLIKHLQFSAVLASFIGIAALFLTYAPGDPTVVLQWGVVAIMALVGGTIGGLLAYDD